MPTAFAVLLLEGVYLAREIDFVAKALAGLGIVLAAVLAYYGWRKLQPPVRGADEVADQGVTPGRSVVGILLLLPAGGLLVLAVNSIVATQGRTRAQLAWQQAKRQPLIAQYAVDTVWSHPTVRAYTFDLALHADSTFQLATDIPRLKRYTAGRWRVSHRNEQDGHLRVLLRYPSGLGQELETEDRDSASYLRFYEDCSTPYAMCYMVRLQKRGVRGLARPGAARQ